MWREINRISWSTIIKTQNIIKKEFWSFSPSSSLAANQTISFMLLPIVCICCAQMYELLLLCQRIPFSSTDGAFKWSKLNKLTWNFTHKTTVKRESLGIGRSLETRRFVVSLRSLAKNREAGERGTWNLAQIKWYFLSFYYCLSSSLLFTFHCCSDGFSPHSPTTQTTVVCYVWSRQLTTNYSPAHVCLIWSKLEITSYLLDIIYIDPARCRSESFSIFFSRSFFFITWFFISCRLYQVERLARLKSSQTSDDVWCVARIVANFHPAHFWQFVLKLFNYLNSI